MLVMKVLFLDESGDHNLAVIDPQYPLFVLGGIIVVKEYAEGERLGPYRISNAGFSGGMT